MYKEKYIKYKIKYFDLKSQLGGMPPRMLYHYPDFLQPRTGLYSPRVTPAPYLLRIHQLEKPPEATEVAEAAKTVAEAKAKVKAKTNQVPLIAIPTTSGSSSGLNSGSSSGLNSGSSLSSVKSTDSISILNRKANKLIDKIDAARLIGAEEEQ